MALRRQFLDLVVDLRNALGQSTNVAVGVDMLPRLKWALNRAYQQLGDDVEWPHLVEMFGPIQTAAGQRFYDLPTDLNYDRVQEAKVWWGGRPRDVERGIAMADFVSYDSTVDERSGPVLKWDIRFDSNREQVEVWPIPVGSDSALWFRGERRLARLVNDIDLCLLDDDLVVTKAALTLAKDDTAKKVFAAELAERMATLKANAVSNLPAVSLSPSSPGRPDYKPVVVRVR